MASTTTTLNLKKPALTDDALIGDINDNMDIIDTYASTNNAAISNVASPAGTNDVLADALQTTVTKCFKASGSSYTGTIPDNDYKYATFLVVPRDTNRSVLAVTVNGKVASNYYSGGWTGWKELALKNDIKATLTFDGDVTNTDVTVYKSGGFCAINGTLSINTTIAGNNKIIISLPSGFRPPETVHIYPYANYGGTLGHFRFSINSSGSLLTSTGGNTFSGTIYFFATFPCA